MKKRLILKRVSERNCRIKRLFRRISTRKRLHQWYYYQNILIRFVIRPLYRPSLSDLAYSARL